MKYIKKILCSLLVVGFLMGIVPAAHAATIFPLVVKTATATTSLSYMSAGLGTTTLTYDSYKAGLTKTDNLALGVQFTASSSATSQLNINEEFSQDGIDWYQSPEPNVFNVATTSTVVAVGQVGQYQWPFASSTPGLGPVAATNNEDNRLIMVNSPLRFIRFIFTMKLGGTAGAVWAEIIPAKVSPN